MQKVSFLRVIEIYTYPPKQDANTSPRVPETVRPHRVTRIQPPRVARRTAPRVATNTRRRLETIAKTEHPIGTIIMRKINKKMQRGTVTRFNKNSGYYWIDYDNNDLEELTHRLVARYLLGTRNTLTSRLLYKTTPTIPPSNVTSNISIYKRNQPKQSTRVY